MSRFPTRRQKCRSCKHWFQLQSQLAQGGGAAQTTLITPMDCRSEGPIVKRCRWEDFVPHCDEEMQEWMQGRHADLQTAVGAGQLQEVARISKLLTTAAQEWQELINQSATMPSSVANAVR